jgi:hypothetical protein
MAFDYIVVIEQGNGAELARWVMTAATSHPAVGDDIEVDGELHVVHKVRHVPHPHDASSRRAMIAEVHVRRDRESAGDPAKPASKRGAGGTVLPFTARQPSPRSCRLAQSWLRLLNPDEAQAGGVFCDRRRDGR